MSSWDTIVGPPVKESLRKRALKREVEAVRHHVWLVQGDPKLDDSYPDYYVELQKIEGKDKYHCECRTHYGGEARRFCSHVLAVIYYRQNHDDIPSPEIIDLPSVAPQSNKQGGPEAETPSMPMPAAGVPPTPRPLQLIEIGSDTPQDLPSVSGEPPIPEMFSEFRSHQIPAIEQVVNLFNAGYKVVILEAPTGTGKTLISEAVRRLVGRRGVYTCTTKTLQNQVIEDFPYAKLLKGRNNYPTFDNPSITADVCIKVPATLPACPGCPGWIKGDSWQNQEEAWEDESLVDDDGIALHCNFCHPVHMCAYEIAKGEAMDASLAVLNTAYLLNEANGPARFSNKDYIILDEADMLEQELMSYIEVSLTKTRRDSLRVGEPKYVGKEDSWVEWIRDKVIPAVDKEFKELSNRATDQGALPKLLKAIKSNRNLKQKLAWLVKPTDEEDHHMTGWVMNEYAGTLTFKPVRVSEYGQSFLWRHSKRFLLMSATVVSPEQMASDLGLEDGEWAVVHVPSTFPIERRPIALETVGKVIRKTRDESYGAVGKKVADIMRRHPDQRMLVHTVSYELNKIIEGQVNRARLGDRVITYYNAREREDALADYLNTSNGVLLSPSFERGVDLPHDACRVIVVAKMPYPYLGDKQIKARTYGTYDGNMWYAVQTIRTLCQMTGRGMRSADDWAISYILDSSFLDLYSPNRRLFPGWWTEAVVWDQNDPKWKRSVLNGMHM